MFYKGSQLSGLLLYEERLDKIATQCGENKKKDEATLDEFDTTKRKLYDTLVDARKNIISRHTMLKNGSHNRESVELSAKIRRQLEELDTTYPKLQKLLQGKSRGSWRNSNKTVPKEERETRIEDMRLLNRQIKEARDLYERGIAEQMSLDIEAPSDVPSAFGGDLRDAARRGSVEKGKLLDNDEERVIGDIRHRDSQHDQKLDAMGQVLHRLNDVATQIGATAERHSSKADALATDVENADEKLKKLNKRMDEIKKYEKSTNFCCQFMLFIALLACAGFIYQQLG